jgi:hypothetical protein
MDYGSTIYANAPKTHLDEEELGLGNLETERLEIITAIEGISQSKKQYSQQVLKQNTLQVIDQLKATRTYTIRMARSVTTWWASVCTARKINWKKAKIFEDIPISAVEMKAIQMAMQHISGQEAKRNH